MEEPAQYTHLTNISKVGSLLAVKHPAAGPPPFRHVFFSSRPECIDLFDLGFLWAHDHAAIARWCIELLGWALPNQMLARGKKKHK